MGHFRKQMISFFLTSQCNLGCVYCYIPKLGKTIKVEDRVLDLEFAVAGMREFFAWAPEPYIRFFSAGEPTAAFKRMVEVREAAYEMAGKRLKVELQTNGYFKESVAKWIEDNVNVVWISCDGPPEIQDRQRPRIGGGPSSKVVLRNIERFARNDRMEFGVRATFDRADFGRQVEILDFFRSMGVKYVCGAPAYSSMVNREVEVPVLVDFARHFEQAFFRAQEMEMFYNTHLIVNFDEQAPAYCRACTTPVCPQLTSDGYVSCCDWAAFGPEYFPGPIQQCVYGRWNRDSGEIEYFAERKARIEGRNTENLGKGACRGCDVLEHCAGGCIGKVLSRSGDLYRMDRNWCQATRYLAERILPEIKDRFPRYHS